MRRVGLFILSVLLAAPVLGQPSKSPLTRGLADALYVKLAGGNTVLGLSTFTNLTVTGTCTGCGGGGTVTSVGNGTIGSLFTVTWATATTTPAFSLDITNQGTTAQVLHGNAAGHPSWGSVVSADMNITTTTCTNQLLRGITSTAGGTCSAIVDADVGGITKVGKWTFTQPATGITLTGTDNATYTMPGSTQTILGLTASQSPTNKTFDNTNVFTAKGLNFTLQDDTDTTKQLRFIMSGITTGNTRSVTVPNSNTTIPIFSQAVTFSGPTAARTVTLPDANTTVWTATQPITISGPTAGRTWTAPDANFSFARIDAAQTFAGNETFSNQIFHPDGTSSAPADSWTNDTGIGWWRQASGVSCHHEGTNANTCFFFTGALPGIEALQDGGSQTALQLTGSSIQIPPTVSYYNGAGTAGVGLSAIYGSVTLATQAASIGTTNAYASAPAGQYRVCWNQQITRAATTSSSLLTTIGWNNGSAKTSTLSIDDAAGTTQTTADASNTLNSERGDCINIISAASQNITYATTYASTGGTTMQYALRVTVERIQ